MSWKALSISLTSEIDSTVKNALFYSDEVTWCPLSYLMYSLTIEGILGIVNQTTNYAKESPEKLIPACIELINTNEDESERESHLRMLGECINFLQNSDDIIEKGFDLNKHYTGNASNDYINTGQEVFRTLLIRNPAERGKARENLRIFKTEYESIYDGISGISEPPIVWNPYFAANEMLSTLRKTNILPDVSNLDLDEIFELKQSLREDFDPMRAELLRMTKTLRETTKNNPDKVIIEAQNLVATEIRPILLDSRKLIMAEAKKKNRNYLKKILHTVGLIGIGFLNPKSFLDAANEGNKMMGELITDNDIKTESAIVNFSIAIQGGLTKYED